MDRSTKKHTDIDILSSSSETSLIANLSSFDDTEVNRSISCFTSYGILISINDALLSTAYKNVQLYLPTQVYNARCEVREGLETILLDELVIKRGRKGKGRGRGREGEGDGKGWHTLDTTRISYNPQQRQPFDTHVFAFQTNVFHLCIETLAIYCDILSHLSWIQE